MFFCHIIRSIQLRVLLLSWTSKPAIKSLNDSCAIIASAMAPKPKSRGDLLCALRTKRISEKAEQHLESCMQGISKADNFNLANSDYEINIIRKFDHATDLTIFHEFDHKLQPRVDKEYIRVWNYM